MTNYKRELAEVFKALIANNPYHYQSTDLSVLERDWSHFFNKNNIPAERLLDIYYEVIEQKANSNNTFGIVTNVDMLNGWNSLQTKVKGMNSAEKCEVCGKYANEKAGFFTSYDASRKKDFLVKCQRQHVK
jgi:hypothetical protein